MLLGLTVITMCVCVSMQLAREDLPLPGRRVDRDTVTFRTKNYSFSWNSTFWENDFFFSLKLDTSESNVFIFRANFLSVTLSFSEWRFREKKSFIYVESSLLGILLFQVGYIRNLNIRIFRARHIEYLFYWIFRVCEFSLSRTVVFSRAEYKSLWNVILLKRRILEWWIL